MKYINKLSALAASTVLSTILSGCQFEQEDFFDESAAIRIESTKTEIKKCLVDQSNNGNYGWAIQYFVAGTDDLDFEGFNLFGKFYDSGKVTLASNHRYLRNGNKNKYTESTSFYEMLSEEGPVLAFNTWNDVLSVFADPADPSAAPDAVNSDGEGMNGDDRLVCMSYGPTEMVFEGERHRGRVYFTALDRDAQQYIADVAKLKADVANEKMTEYKVVASDSITYISGLNKGYFTVCDRLDDPLLSETKSCAFTPDGFRLARETGFGSAASDTCTYFVVNSDSTKFSQGSVDIYPCWTRVVKRLSNTAGKTMITTDGACESLANLLNKLANDVHSSFSAQTFSGLSFGRSSEAGDKSRFGLVFFCSTNKSKYYSGFTGTLTIDDEANTAVISVDPNDPSNNFSNYEKKGLGPDFIDIVNAMNGTYKIEVNKPFNPSRVTFTKQSDPNFYFVLTL